jgi:hypothetical protein
MARTSYMLGLLVVAALALVATAEHCPQTSLRSDTWAKGVASKLKEISFSSDRVAYLRQEILNDTRAISGLQLTWILPPLVFAGDMVQAMNFTSPFVIGLNVSDFVAVLNVFTFSGDKLVALRAIKDTLLDASDANKQLIVNSCFTFSSDKQAALEILSTVVARDCVFGTVTAKSATFVIDISGSMDTRFTLNGRAYSRLSYVVEHLSKVISEQLKPYQEYNIIIFNDSPAICFTKPAAATPANIQTGLAFLRKWSARGGTNTYSALSLAFSSSPDTVAVYLLSDGLPNSGQAPQIINALPQWNAKRAANRQINVFSTAFLLGASSGSEKKESAAFMEQVAAVTKGVFRNMDMN